MTLGSQRIVPTLTEVLDAADLQFSGRGDWPKDVSAKLTARGQLREGLAESAAAVPESALIDDVLRKAITDAVDTAIADMRAQLLPRVEALMLRALEAQANRAAP